MINSNPPQEALPNWLPAEQVPRLAESYGSPLYVYSESALLGQAEQALSIDAPFGHTVRFAMKANPNPSVLEAFRDAGLHIDASSGCEAERAMEAGFSPDQVMITSQQIPKNLEELVEQGVLFNATSLHQLETYCELFPGSEVSVRINPGIGSGMNRRTTTGGVSSSFGIWHEYIPQVREIADKHGVRINKLHTHIGSGTDPEEWAKAALTSLAIAEQFDDVVTLNLGGGFKVGRMAEESSANMTVIGEHLHIVLKEFAHRTGRELHLEIEPGTFLVANAGVLIAQIIDKTDTGETGFTFLRTDTGMNDNMRPSLYGAQHPLITVQADGSLPTEKAELVVVGHNCESGDILTPAPGDPETISPRVLGEVSIGDFVVIGGAGAYGASMSAHGYNSYPSAKEVVID